MTPPTKEDRETGTTILRRLLLQLTGKGTHGGGLRSSEKHTEILRGEAFGLLQTQRFNQKHYI